MAEGCSIPVCRERGYAIAEEICQQSSEIELNAVVPANGK